MDFEDAINYLPPDAKERYQQLPMNGSEYQLAKLTFEVMCRDDPKEIADYMLQLLGNLTSMMRQRSKDRAHMIEGYKLLREAIDELETEALKKEDYERILFHGKRHV